MFVFACFALLATAVAMPSDDLPVAANKSPVDCGNGYSSYGGGNCYKLHDVFVHWNEGKSKCEEEGAYLAIVKNAEEANQIKELISDQSGWAWTWVGLSDVGNNEWRSIHGDNVNDIFHSWVSSATFKNHCGAITHHALLEDMPCDGEKLAFVCEKAH